MGGSHRKVIKRTASAVMYAATQRGSEDQEEEEEEQQQQEDEQQQQQQEEEQGDNMLSENQMEILELEMRARAIKAMLKGANPKKYMP